MEPVVLRITKAAGFEQVLDRHKPTLLSAAKPTEGRSRRIGSPKCLNHPVMGGSVLLCERFGMMARKIGYTGPSMSQAGSCARRFLLIVLVLCATICAQSASLTAEQETHQGSDHCCGLCHLGPAPILPATASAVTAPVFSPVSITVSVVIGAPHDTLVTSSASRAPPA